MASGPRAVTFKRMGQKDPRAYQPHQCRNRLDHREIPVRPCSRETACGLAQSKEFQGLARQWGLSEVLAQQNVQEWHRAGCLRSVDQRGMRTPRLPSRREGCGLPISAEFGLR